MENFDYDYYLKNNQDLSDYCKNLDHPIKKIAYLKNHYQSFGIKEGRKARFNKTTISNDNELIQKLINNFKKKISNK